MHHHEIMLNSTSNQTPAAMVANACGRGRRHQSIAQAPRINSTTQRRSSVARVASVTTIACVLGWWTAPAYATNRYDITLNNDAHNTHNLVDVIVEVIGIPKIDAIDSNGPFTVSKISSSKKAAGFGGGGSIPPGGSGTVAVDLDHKVTGVNPVVVEETSWQSDPLSFGTSQMIFSGAIASGATGADFAGIAIPAGEFLYVYECQWLGPASGPTSFEVTVPGGAPTSMGVLANTWAPGTLLPVPGPITTDGMGFTTGQSWTVSANMLPGNLTGTAGVSPASWGFSLGKMVASFATPLASSDVTSVMWFTSPFGPEFGAPDLAGHNAALADGTGTLFDAAVEAPAPEPTTFVLAAIGSAVAAAMGRRSRNRRRTTSQ